MSFSARLVAVILTAVAAACSRSEPSSLSSPSPVSAPVAEAPGIALRVDEGSCCNRSPEREIPWVAYGACRRFSITGTASSMTYYETMSVYGADDTFYFSSRQGPETLNAGVTKLGCIGGFRDSDASRVGAQYRLRIDYTFDNGVTGSAEGSAGLRITPAFVTGIIIRQFRSRGPRGAEDQFVELLNISDHPINVDAWSITTSLTGARIDHVAALSGAGQSVINPGCSYLATSFGYGGTVTRDALGPIGLSDTAGIAVRTREGQIVDQVAMSENNLFLKGSALEPFGTANTDRAYLRVGNTGDDRQDYRMTTPGAPRNRSMCGR